jgi:hypothetical protein
MVLKGHQPLSDSLGVKPIAWGKLVFFREHKIMALAIESKEISIIQALFRPEIIPPSLTMRLPQGFVENGFNLGLNWEKESWA